MPKPEWGIKRTCGSCDAKFYDFRKDPIVCPNCEAEFKVTSQPARKKPAEMPKAAVAEKASSESLDDSDDDFEDVGDIDDDSMLLDDDDDDDFDEDDNARVI